MSYGIHQIVAQEAYLADLLKMRARNVESEAWVVLPATLTMCIAYDVDRWHVVTNPRIVPMDTPHFLTSLVAKELAAETKDATGAPGRAMPFVDAMDLAIAHTRAFLAEMQQTKS